MSDRKLAGIIKEGETEFSVHYNSDVDEYTVKVREMGRRLYNGDRTYFASDKEDALRTRLAMVSEERQNQLRSNNEELNGVVLKCQLLQKLWDTHKLMSGTLREIGRNLEGDDIGPHNRQYYADKALNTAELISDGAELCFMLHKAGVSL